MQTAAGIHRIFPSKMEGDEPMQGKKDNNYHFISQNIINIGTTKKNPVLEPLSTKHSTEDEEQPLLGLALAAHSYFFNTCETHGLPTA
jgi:hypothetical protein